ncbi:GTPase family protein [Nocardioides jishulii]|uniref:DUF697 domain-containing protein n=1 Tax=Nocardioides jishulii TaxID=2575440 RepID=A0A4U2YNU4_9ACTN|nr:DUF697 domain-containing protein [Nocardioides jishulii]QCX27863.1 DUF697 domain-containing protein [Nocardioides jishulii]TKI62670.1 DUF697 domain-containing protein [Nocardioides jishulii]
MDKISEAWVKRTLADRRAEHADEVGRFNLALFGKTGVGKSTLVNAVFGSQVAETGVGRPVTKGHHLYLYAGDTLGLYDTQGLELGRDDETLFREVRELVSSLRRKPVREQIHVAWYCVRARDGRFEDSEARFVQLLNELGLPVVLVLTQVPSRDGRPAARAEELAEHIHRLGLRLVGDRVFFTMAEDDDFDGPAHGLQEVLDATFRVTPDAAREALASAQTIDFALKRKQARTYVAAATSSAAVTAASPIPFSDAALLVPLQLGMLAKIAHLYGVSVERSTALALASTAAATTAGRSAAGNLLKFIPGANVAGGVLNASVASTLTLAMGEAWIQVCDLIARGAVRPELLRDTTALRELFMTAFKEQATKAVRRSA